MLRKWLYLCGLCALVLGAKAQALPGPSRDARQVWDLISSNPPLYRDAMLLVWKMYDKYEGGIHKISRELWNRHPLFRQRAEEGLEYYKAYWLEVLRRTANDLPRTGIPSVNPATPLRVSLQEFVDSLKEENLISEKEAQRRALMYVRACIPDYDTHSVEPENRLAFGRALARARNETDPHQLATNTLENWRTSATARLAEDYGRHTNIAIAHMLTLREDLEGGTLAAKLGVSFDPYRDPSVDRITQLNPQREIVARTIPAGISRRYPQKNAPDLFFADAPLERILLVDGSGHQIADYWDWIPYRNLAPFNIARDGERETALLTGHHLSSIRDSCRDLFDLLANPLLSAPALLGALKEQETEHSHSLTEIDSYMGWTSFFDSPVPDSEEVGNGRGIISYYWWGLKQSPTFWLDREALAVNAPAFPHFKMSVGTEVKPPPIRQPHCNHEVANASGNEIARRRSEKHYKLQGNFPARTRWRTADNDLTWRESSRPAVFSDKNTDFILSSAGELVASDGLAIPRAPGTRLTSLHVSANRRVFKFGRDFAVWEDREAELYRLHWKATPPTSVTLRASFHRETLPSTHSEALDSIAFSPVIEDLERAGFHPLAARLKNLSANSRLTLQSVARAFASLGFYSFNGKRFGQPRTVADFTPLLNADGKFCAQCNGFNRLLYLCLEKYFAGNARYKMEQHFGYQTSNTEMTSANWHTWVVVRKDGKLLASLDATGSAHEPPGAPSETQDDLVEQRQAGALRLAQAMRPFEPSLRRLQRGTRLDKSDPQNFLPWVGMLFKMHLEGESTEEELRAALARYGIADLSELRAVWKSQGISLGLQSALDHLLQVVQGLSLLLEKSAPTCAAQLRISQSS